LLTPLANRLERWRIPRMLSVILVVAMSFSVLGLLGWVVTDQLVARSPQQSVTEQSLSKKTKWIFDKINLVVNGVSHFGKHPADAPAAEKNADGKKSAAREDTAEKKSDSKKQEDKKQHDSGATLADDAKKLKAAGKSVESPVEREAI